MRGSDGERSSFYHCFWKETVCFNCRWWYVFDFIWKTVKVWFWKTIITWKYESMFKVIWIVQRELWLLEGHQFRETNNWTIHSRTRMSFRSWKSSWKSWFRIDEEDSWRVDETTVFSYSNATCFDEWACIWKNDERISTCCHWFFSI